MGISAPSSQGWIEAAEVPREYRCSVKKPIEMCSALRGISWRWIMERQCLWMGIRPSGLGERLKSRQYEEVDGAADEGER